jgi:ADP-heptose:LPS heptosyltransferase
MKKIIIFDLLLIGDIINAAHIAASLKDSFNNVTVDVLTYKSNKDVTETLPFFNQKYYIDRGKILKVCNNAENSILKKFSFLESQIKELTVNDYDLLINFTNNKISAIIASIINSKKIVGAVLDENKILTVQGENSWIKYFNDFVTTDYYNSFQYIDVFKKAIGIDPALVKDGVVEKDTFKKDSNKKYFCMKTITSEVNKNWDDNKYIDTARAIIEKTGYSCLLLGVEKEKKYLEWMRDEISLDTKIGIYSFKELIPILSNAKFVIGGDTGILHLASMLKTKTITISLGPGTYFKSTPYGEGNIILYPKEKCYPCRHLVKCSYSMKCRSNIGSKDVLDAIFKGKIKSFKCGALKTYFDEDGFLSYENINEVFDREKNTKYLRLRKIFKEYLDEKDLNSYNFNELKSIITQKKILKNKHVNYC